MKPNTTHQVNYVNKKYLILFAAAAVANMFFAPRLNGQQSNCKAPILAYVEKNAKVSPPTGNTVYYLHYTVKTEYYPKVNTPSTESFVKVLRSKNVVFYESNKLSVYTDGKESVAVIPDLKKVIVDSSAFNPMEKENIQNLSSFEDKLIRNARVVSCTTKDDVMTVVLKPSEEDRKKHRLDKMEIIYSLKEERIQQVTNHHTEESPVKKQTVVYHAMDYNYKGKVASSAYSKVFSSYNKLRESYSGYEIIDKRKNIQR